MMAVIFICRLINTGQTRRLNDYAKVEEPASVVQDRRCTKDDFTFPARLDYQRLH